MNLGSPTQLHHDEHEEHGQVAERSTQRLHVEILRRELEARKKRNPRYSLRAFALHLGIDPAALSRILAGKQEVSLRAAQQILEALKLSPEDTARFQVAVAESMHQRATRFFEQGGATTSSQPTFHAPVGQSLACGSAMIDPARLGEVRELFSTFVKTLEQMFPCAEAKLSLRLTMEKENLE